MWPSAKQTQREQKWRRGIMKSSDSELQVLMDEAQGKKRQGSHLTVSERNHIRDGVSPCESDVVCECNTYRLWGMGLRFEGKEGRSYNNPSIHPAVFERGAPGPGGRGILIGLLKRLSWLPERRSGAAVPLQISRSDGRVFTLSLDPRPAAHWRKRISAFWSFWSPPKHHCPPAQASCLPPAPSVF